MAGSSRAALRRREEAAQARRDRLILLGAFVVLGMTAIVLLVGVFVTVYQPPRRVVATIDGRDLKATEVVDRATFYMVSEGGAFTQQEDDLAEVGVDRLVRDAVLLKEAPALVGEVSNEDVDAKTREVLGNLEGAAHEKALKNVLERAGIDLAEYREILKARMLADRLTEQFKGELPATMAQRRVQRVRAPSLVNAERVVERGRAGEDFEALARQYGADRRLAVDQGWMPEELLEPEVRAAIESLGAGDVSGPVSSGLFFDVYRVIEQAPERELTAEQQSGLAERRVNNWIDEHETALGVRRDLTASTSEWITTRVTDRARKAFEAAQAQTVVPK